MRPCGFEVGIDRPIFLITDEIELLAIVSRVSEYANVLIRRLEARE